MVKKTDLLTVALAIFFLSKKAALEQEEVNSSSEKNKKLDNFHTEESFDRDNPEISE